MTRLDAGVVIELVNFDGQEGEKSMRLGEEVMVGREEGVNPTCS